jgi:DNA-binding NarL/FixJ family response regulator
MPKKKTVKKFAKKRQTLDTIRDAARALVKAAREQPVPLQDLVEAADKMCAVLDRPHGRARIDSSTIDRIEALKEEGLSNAAIAKKLTIGVATVHKYLGFRQAK